MKLALFSVVIWTLCSCSATRVAGPSTSGVEAKISQAQASNTEAQRYNDLARTASQRIEDKVIVIDRYWK